MRRRTTASSSDGADGTDPREVGGPPLRVVGGSSPTGARTGSPGADEAVDPLSLVLAALDEGVVVQDGAGQVLSANSAAERILGPGALALVTGAGPAGPASAGTGPERCMQATQMPGSVHSAVMTRWSVQPCPPFSSRTARR